ncbi:MAG: sigma 54-interacting transcriptional regulator [Desulfatiglans sp.]|jgi:PAS domain S-box-containing protein|nr:sigma 54-interacting transcriptional regulator [Desulfatiglans sp.]
MENIQENQTRIILDSIADGVFTVDSDWRITSFNRAAENITGISKKDALGRHCWEVFRASICESHCSLRHTVETGSPVVNQSIYIVNANGDRVPISISTALLKNNRGKVIGGVETFRDLSLVETLKKELDKSHSFHDIISKDEEMQRLFGILEQLADSDSTVLIEGESGTGKELFAKAIHSMSARKKRPVVTINCGAIPDNLLESELFGYKAGAFTDAKKDKAGRIALAEGGTLFLDEIGDISPALQVRLLRVIQDKTYEPLGSTKTEKANVRFVAATNKNLENLVKEKKFREDLYYRINVVRLKLPPLRDRKGDIPLLVSHFIKRFNDLKGKNILGLKPDVMPLLMAHQFSGNIRELENILDYATVVCKNGYIGIEHLPDYLAGSTKSVTPPPLARDITGIKEMERNYIYSALEKNRWNRKATASALGIHPATLWRKIRQMGISPTHQDGRSKFAK